VKIKIFGGIFGFEMNNVFKDGVKIELDMERITDIFGKAVKVGAAGLAAIVMAFPADGRTCDSDTKDKASCGEHERRSYVCDGRITQKRVDYIEGKGALEFIYDENGYLIRKVVDKNNDAKPDIVMDYFYDQEGYLIRVTIDEEGDGRIEAAWEQVIGDEEVIVRLYDTTGVELHKVREYVYDKEGNLIRTFIDKEWGKFEIDH